MIHPDHNYGQSLLAASPNAIAAGIPLPIKGIGASATAGKGLISNADSFLPSLPETAPKLLGLGSTGRYIPQNLKEQVAMTAVRAEPAGIRLNLREPLKDPRWPGADGWVKMQQIENGVNIHYVRNTITGAVDDFKFK